jgi:hypothetical protein
MTTAEHHVAHRPREEQAAFDNLVERIKGQFPELDQEVIADAVRGEYGKFETSPIRDFLPILIERSVRSELAQAAPRHGA